MSGRVLRRAALLAGTLAAVVWACAALLSPNGLLAMVAAFSLCG